MVVRYCIKSSSTSILDVDELFLYRNGTRILVSDHWMMRSVIPFLLRNDDIVMYKMLVMDEYYGQIQFLATPYVIGVLIEEAMNTNYFDLFEREVLRNESYRHCSSY